MNSTLDLTALIRGLFVVIGMALAVGQYPNLEHWARGQAAESIAWKRGLPHFFGGVHADKNHKHRRSDSDAKKVSGESP